MIPDKIKIGGLTYKVNTVLDVDEDNSNVDGKIIYNKLEIKLKENMPEEYAECVLLHEIIHGIFNLCQFEQKEAEIEQLSHALYQVLKDNFNLTVK